MPDASDVLWFKQQFQARILPALAGTPLSVDMVVAAACQETGHIWPLLRRKGLPLAQILALCVGDTLDASKGRSAFPRNKAELLARPRGDAMFRIGRQALVAMAAQVPGYSAAAALPDKFCHGYGIFQRDLQFFVGDPDYFLQRRYEIFEDTLAQCVGELKGAVRQLGFQNRDSLSALELAAVGIAYNTGGFNRAKGLKQGYFNGSSYYGELIFGFIQLAQANPFEAPDPVPAPAPAPAFAAATPLAATPVAREPIVTTNAGDSPVAANEMPERSVAPRAVAPPNAPAH
jgi:hypothetical protein